MTNYTIRPATQADVPVISRIMETIHTWCRARGLKTVALNASEFGRPLYESMGYRLHPAFLKLILEDD